jgi:hypothetical protein
MSRLVGRLVDSQTGRPVEGALVELTALARRALSDSTGTFTFLDVPAGTYGVHIQHIAYGEQTSEIQVRDVHTTVVALGLTPVAIEVAPLDVAIEFRPRYLEERGFYERRARGIGTFFDPQFVERWSAGSFASFFGSGGRREGVGGSRGFMGLIEDMSPGFGSATCLGGQPVIYLDGRKRSRLFLADMSTYEVGAVEAYSGTGGTPVFALDPDAGCGVIAIWTNRWRGRTDRIDPEEVELCTPERDGGTAIEGVVRDEFTEVLLPGARVTARVRETREQRSAREVEVFADIEGRYRVCDVPRDGFVTLRASALDESREFQELTADAPLIRRDLQLPVSGPGRMLGRVVDGQTKRPVSAASVAVSGTRFQTLTDEMGYFALDEVLPGDHLIEIRHLGYEPLVRPVSVFADRTLDVRVELSVNPIEVEPLVVTTLRNRRLELRGFYDRQRWGQRLGLGAFVSQEEIERRNPIRISHLIGDVQGIELNCRGSARGCQIGSTRGVGCDQLDVFINGSLALGRGRADGVSIDELVRPTEIAAMEVYPSAASVPAEFTGLSGRCGAIVIWTR